MIECVEEFFLGTFLSDNKLDVVDQKNVVVPVFFTERSHGKFIAVFTDLQRIDQFIGKSLTCDIQHMFIRFILNNEMSDRMHQMGFAESGASIYKERIVNLTRRFGHGQ